MNKSIRFFDQDGNEIKQEPINVDDQEFIGEIGGNCDEYSIGLNFYSEELDKDEISNLLNHKPTKSWNPNELHPIGNGQKFRKTNWGKWYLQSDREKIDLNLKIQKLLQQLNNDLDVWIKLTTKYECWIDIAGYMENWNRTLSINKYTLKLLAERNLEITFDAYYYGNDKETE